MEPADVFLRWVSERGSGATDAIRETVAWLFADAVPGGRWWIIADRLADLGHIDRGAGRWSASPPVLNYLPPRSMQSVVCGARTLDVTRRIIEVAKSDAGAEVDLQRIPQPGGPAAWVVVGTRHAAADFAALAGLAFIDDAADRIANRIGQIQGMLPPGSHVRGGGESISVFDSDRLEFRSARDLERPGLYKIAGAGGPRFAYSPRAGWYHDVDPRLGTYLELARQRRPVLRYVRGDLWAPRYAPLPDAHRRCLTLCTGFLPGVERDQVRYEAVPKVIAEKVAFSLGQRLIEAIPPRNHGGQAPR